MTQCLWGNKTFPHSPARAFHACDIQKGSSRAYNSRTPCRRHPKPSTCLVSQSVLGPLASLIASPSKMAQHPWPQHKQAMVKPGPSDPSKLIQGCSKRVEADEAADLPSFSAAKATPPDSDSPAPQPPPQKWTKVSARSGRTWDPGPCLLAAKANWDVLLPPHS